MNFEKALKALKQGKNLRRSHWGTEFYVNKENSSNNTPYRKPYLYLDDFMANDWEIAEDLLVLQVGKRYTVIDPVGTDITYVEIIAIDTDLPYPIIAKTYNRMNGEDYFLIESYSIKGKHKWHSDKNIAKEK